jgi:SEC-C motif-containing protein
MTSPSHCSGRWTGCGSLPWAPSASRNQPCRCGSGRKYKACCRVRDLDGGVHPLPRRAPALYAMFATYARRGPNRNVADRMAACAIGAPHAAMLALDLAIFDGGTARRFLAARRHLLRDDERDLLGEWLVEPMDMYEVSSVRRGSDLSLRSLVGGPQQVGQRDRLFSLSVQRLDIVIGRLLPDGARPDGGSRHLQALGGMGILPRDLREAAEALFADGPVAPGSVPLFPERLLSQFAGQSSPVFQTADGDEYRWCETTIEVRSAGKVWPLLTGPAWLRPGRRSETRTATTPISSRCPGASGHAIRRTRSNTPARSSRAGSPTSGPSGAA